MLAIPHNAAFLAVLIGVLSIAAALWWEARREGLRRRLVRKIEALLNQANCCRPGEEHFKRVA